MRAAVEVHRLAMLQEVEYRIKVRFDSIRVVRHRGELGLDDFEAGPDTALLNSEEVERNGVCVVGSEQFRSFAEQRISLRLKL